MTASARLGQLGVALPEVVAPLASYVPAVRTGNLVYTSGQLPIEGGKLAGTGKVGREISPEKGKALARICALSGGVGGGYRRGGTGGQGRRVRRLGAGFQWSAKCCQRGLRPARRGVRR